MLSLKPGATYYVVVSREKTNTSSILHQLTNLATQHAGNADGWSIDAPSLFYTDATSTWADEFSNDNLVIEVAARDPDIAALTEKEVPFGWSLTPDGIAGEEKFRLLFLTDEDHATSTNIDIYNHYVQSQAEAGHADIQEHATQFRVLGSTADDDARDNTETTYTAMQPGVPIYWMNGAKVADDYQDLYDGAWSNEELPRLKDGSLHTFDTSNIPIIWTGSKDDGTESFAGIVSAALGEGNARSGRLNVGGSNNPLASQAKNSSTNSYPFYALSGVFVVEANTPATATAAITGTPRVGETLTAALSDISDPQGITGIEHSYQWTRDDGMNVTDIDGATSETYVLTDADAEHEINVNITFEDDYHNLEGPFTATATEAVVPTEVLVRNKYVAQAGLIVGMSNSKRAQQFTTGSETDGYRLEGLSLQFSNIVDLATVGANLTVTLNEDSSGSPGNEICALDDPSTFDAAGGIHTFAVSADAPCPNLQATTDYFLVASTTETTANVAAMDVVSHDTQNEGSLAGWSIADNGHVYDTGNQAWATTTTLSLIIEVRGTVAVPNITATGVPTISGTAKEGSALTAGTSGIADGNGLGTLKYQWVRVTGTVQTDIDGATASTYTLTEDDLDKTIIVRVSFIDQDGHPEGPLSSAASGVVTAPNLLVKNTLAGVNAIATQASHPRIGQAFTTGSSLAGYQLNSLGFRLHAVADPASAGNDLEVTLNEVASSGEPGAALCTLDDPATFRANSINRFTAPSGDDCPKLSRNTTYFAVLHRVAFTGSNAITVGVATGSAQDEGSAANWSIADSGYFGASTTWLASLLNYRIEVTGEEALEVEVPQGWSLMPTGLVGGQKFRLLFITLTGYSSANTDIEGYNTYVQSQANAANAHTDIKAYNSHFRVLGSTADVDARDNTRTNPSDYTSAPIYWMGGAKVADNYGDFYDGSWDSEMSSGQAGIPSSSAYTLWTGSENQGTRASAGGVYQTLGSTSVRIGRLNGAGEPLSSSNGAPATNLHYYALSNIFVVPNAEATGQPAVTGTPRVNETLTADTSGITDPEGTSNAVFTYQWVRVDGSEADIPNATGSTYRPKDEDADKKLKVRISFTDNQGFEEGPLVSEPTALIAGRDVLVRNTSRTSNSSQGLTNNRQLRAQAFTTGAAEEGYNLDAIGFLFNNIASTTTAGGHLTATLNEETSGDPGNVLCTLTDPTSFTSSGLHSFTAPTSGTKCPTLTANMTYFAVINRVMVTSDAITLQITNSSGEDPGSVAGFSVGNDRHHSQTGSSWSDVSGQSYQIEVKGAAATEPIVSDHTTWVDNRQGSAETDYENLGSYSIAQGFRTGDTAGIFNVNEIHIDFDSGQTEYQKITLLITESTTPDAEVNTGRPSGFRKGGSFYSQEVDSDGTVTFPRHSGYKWLEANTNYFLIISSTSNDPNAAPTLRMTEHEGQDSSDGWSIDDQSYSKATAGGARWTRQDHQVRFRISGEYHQGLSLYLEPSKYESCPNKPCVVAVLETDENMGMEGRRFPGSLDSTTTTWISTQENIEFKAALWPIPTAGQWVEFDYNTSGWTATAGEDFINTQGTVLFSPGDKLNTIKVELIDDSIEDSGEQLRMRIGVYLTTTSDAGRTYQPGDFKVRTGGGYPFPEVTKYSAFGTILNSEEETETRWLKVSGATITEGEETAAQFTVSLTGTLTAPVWFNYATVDGSAVAGTHYTATSGETHIPHGATSVTVSVPILDFDDDVYTGNHQFTLQLSNITVAAVGTDSATATIRDDEPQPLTASFTNLPEGNHGESAFKFDISFNQDVATQRLVMQEDAMTVTGGAITGAVDASGAKSLWRITVEPVDGRDVTVELPVTTDCSATGAVCTGGDSPQPLSNSVTHTFPGTQLNAEFEGFDHHHDGSTPMQFRVVFSEEVETTAAEIKDHALTVTGATINTVVQKDEGSTRRWNVTVTPAGAGPFDVILASATDCAQDGHICTPGGELLAQGDWKRSSGPPVISVADAVVTEGDGAQLAFAVTLDRNWSGPAPTVSYATSDGTASAVSDYTAGSGTLTLQWTHTGSLIRPWTLAGAITVPVTNDTVVEETETLTLTLSSPVWATLGDAVATGAIEDDDTAPEPVEPKADDSAPTGLPTITGTPEADSALTADTSAIDDANGLTEVSYSYQWIVTTDGADADIDGATARAYTPRSAHVGRTLKVRVTFTDDDDYEHTLTSEPTTPVTKPADATVWSADMLVVEYTAVSIGAASTDLFSDIGGSGNLQIKSLWSHVPGKDLRLAFQGAFDDAEDHTLVVGDLTLEFPAGSSGEESFKWTGVDLGWEDGQTIAVSIVPTTPAEPVANTAATGEPTISGTPQAGQRLTADTSAISDADGLDNVSYNYQWMADDANIQHATGSTHTLTDDEEGKAIKVKVSFTDDAGNAETLTSQATTAVAPRPNRHAAGAPSIQGVLQDQQVLTPDTVGIIDADGLADVSFSYQWMRVTDGDSSEITGQTSYTYTLTASDVGSSVQLKVAFTDDRDNAESITSALTAAVVASDATRQLLWLSTMTPEDPDGLDTDFQFSSSADEGSLSPAAFTDGEDTRAITFLGASFGSNTTLALELDSEPTTAQIATWRLELQDTEIAFADATMTQTDTSPPSYRFQWDVTAPAVNDRDLWDDGDAFTVSLLEALNLKATGVPTIGGTPQVNETLTAETSGITDGNGLDSVSYAYQWTAGGSNIDGATGSSLTLTSSQEGQTIQVQVSFEDDDGFSETATSVATETVAAAEQANNPATGLPTISGTPQVEQTLTADTSAIDDEDGLSSVSYRYQWLAAGSNIDGATGSSYTPSASDAGKTVQVRVSFTDDADNEETLTSAATTAVAATVPTAPLSLTVTPGDQSQELHASWQAPSSNGGSDITGYKVQWKEAASSWDTAADVSEATVTGTSHTITRLTGGVEYAVRVMATNDAGDGPASTEAKGTPAGGVSEQVVEPENSAPTGLPTISGTAQVGETLTASTSNIADEDGLDGVSYGYRWVRNDGTDDADIAGGTSSTYTLADADEGKTVRVRVTFTDDAGNDESLTSAETETVQARPNSPATGAPAIGGTPQVGETLTASTSDIADQDGLTNVSYRYQWVAGGSDIDGATGSSYILTASEQGQTIKVRVTFTDDAGNQESLTSAATEAVAPQSDNTVADEAVPVWSADMLVVEYSSVSIGAASADLFSNVGGSAGHQVKSLWSYTLGRDLRLAFTDGVPGAEDMTLQVGDLALAFPAGSSGESSFKWSDVDVDWEDGQTLPVRIVPRSSLAEPPANTRATGAPTISGTPRVGVTLTADTSNIADDDGLDNVSYSYQWIRSDNGEGTDIAGETGSTYTLVLADLGKTIKVKVSFTDDADNDETLTSEATVAVAATVPSAPQSLTVTSGSQTQELDVSWQAPSSNGGSDVTGYRVQWKEAVDSWETESDVSEATVTGTTHTITGLTGGVEYAVRVMATNDAGDSPASTEARGTAAAENNAPTGLPGISGTAQVGEILTASTSNIDDEDGLGNVSYRYQWVRNDGTDDADIAGGTGSTYTLVDADQGRTIRVKVSFTDDADNNESLTSAATETVLARPNRAAAGLPTIGGTPQVDETLTADTSAISDEDGLTNVSWSYQWSAGGSDIDGATGSTYTLTASEQGQTIQVQVTFTDDADNEETLTSQATIAVAAASNREATGAPAIGGTPQVGETLTADTAGITDADGLTNVSYEYQWLASGTDIDGATGASYVLTSSEQGQTIQVRVTFTDDADNDESLTSAATETVLARPNRAAAGLPTISGTPQVDQTLTADTSAISDEDGLTNVSWSYQWSAGGSDIDGATGSTYTLVFADQGKTIKVKVSFTDDRGSNESLASVATVAVAAAPNREATGAPSIGGTPQVDQTLTADTSPIADEDGLENVSYSYQWTAGGTDIDGATGASYTLTADEEGLAIQVRVSFEDDADNQETLTSEATLAVAPKPTPLTATFSNMPDSHDGSTEFTFDLTFSENFPLSYKTLRDHAFTEDDNGPITRAQRKVQGSNQTWTITVEPKGNGAITITLPETTDCNATGAICTDDGRKLSNSTTITVPGPQ